MAQTRKRIGMARALRRKDVPAEALLWKVLRNRGLEAFKFRRQHPIGPYVVDFACVSCKIIIELDGESHLTREYPDAKRTQFLEEQGWAVLRFWNPEIYEELERIKEAIYEACVSRIKR
jgi:very-short-patch-repair endonuclease